MINIKKYQNRKLYNTLTGSYITFTGLQELIQADEDFCIIDAKTRNDVTTTVLTEMVCQTLRTAKVTQSKEALRAMLKNKSTTVSQLSFNFT